MVATWNPAPDHDDERDSACRRASARPLRKAARSGAPKTYFSFAKHQPGSSRSPGTVRTVQTAAILTSMHERTDFIGILLLYIEIFL
jgi:hypothetical protein